MTHKHLFIVTILLSQFFVCHVHGEQKESSGLSFYNRLTRFSASDSKIKKGYKPTQNNFSKDKNKRKDKHFNCFKNDTKSSYLSIVDEASERRWSFPVSLSYFLEDNAFNCNGCKVSLSSALFGENTTLRDIFLLARLSDEDKLHIHPRNATPPNPVFGNSREQQYLALLAPMKIGMTAGERGADISISGMYRFKPFIGHRFFCVIGFNLPILVHSRTVDLGLYDGILYRPGFSQNVTIRETTIAQFFKDFSSVEDFFIRAVLGSKGMSFIPSQRKIGIGDFSLFGNLEFGPFFFNGKDDGLCGGLDVGQIGLNISFPTAAKTCGDTFWEMQFGNGGGFQFTIFGNFIFRTELYYVNPALHAGIELNTHFNAGNAGIRTARLVIHTNELLRIGDDPNIVAPVFKEYLSDPFEELDSTVSVFGDKVSSSSVKIGNRFFIGIGNYFYDLFKTNLRFGLFYNFSIKAKDQICGELFSNSDSNVCHDCWGSLCTKYTSIAHRLSWSLSYKFRNFVEVGLGSQHIVAGKNVPEQHEVFLSVATAF